MTEEPLVAQERSFCSTQATTYWGPRKHLVEGALEMEPGFYFVGFIESAHYPQYTIPLGKHRGSSKIMVWEYFSS